MVPAMKGAQVDGLLELGRTLQPGKWHEVARIAGATVNLVRSLPATRDYDVHDDVDELVVVLDGTFRVETPDGMLEARPGETMMVPRGTKHRGRLQEEAIVLIIR